MSINNKVKKSLLVARLRDALLTVQGQLSLQQLVALLTIGTDPGLSVNELAERMRIPQQSASRHVAFLTGRYQIDPTDSPPEVLIEQRISPSDPRSRALYLTSAGQALVAGVVGPVTLQFERDENVGS
jgi:DNA-binding MarR family transcriptional regulator